MVLELRARDWVVPMDRNLQSYWTTAKLWKLAVVLDYCGAIGNLQSYWTTAKLLQSYYTTTKLGKLTVVLDYH
jgi:hypothetical protein